MYFDFIDVVILLFSVFLYVLCGYGTSKDLNEICDHHDFNWVNLLVVLFWPLFIVARSAVHFYEDLK